jgi:hypothetical protein
MSDGLLAESCSRLVDSLRHGIAIRDALLEFLEVRIPSPRVDVDFAGSRFDAFSKERVLEVVRAVHAHCRSKVGKSFLELVQAAAN